MIIKKASYWNFRNLSDVKIDFTDGVNVLWGMNAQGKSNVLEGLYYFARGRSFRGVKDRDLVSFGEAAARIEIEFTRGEGAGVRLGAAIPVTGKKKLYRNGAPLKGSAEMLGNFKAVLFCPSHLSLVSGGPAERRQYLDIAIAQNSQAYIYYLSNYRRFLAERNALLKRSAQGVSVSREEWETYAEQLSVAASEIYALREEYCRAVSDDVTTYFREMTGGRETPCLRYTSQMDGFVADDEAVSADVKSETKEGLYQKLTSNIEREVAVGSTLWGPHKDDVHITLNGNEAKFFASQGQQRSLALSMKLAEGEFSRRSSGEYPVFLLDDVFSELDETRRRFIMESLAGRQIIVTSCEPSVVPGGDFGDIAYFNVSGGKVSEAGGVADEK